MKFLLALLAVVFAHQRTLTEVEYKSKFQDFVTKFNKNYTTAFEWADRYSKFQDNVDKIIAHNEKKLSWTMGVTEFTDMTAFEFAQWVKRGNGGGFVPVAEEDKNYAEVPTVASCSSIDWVARGAVTPVKNQGQCGSCWSFSTTGAVEGAVAAAGQGLTSLSEQNLVDCDKVDSGCNGGLMDYAFEYIINAGGLCREADYPYLAYQQSSCRASTSCGTRTYGKIRSYTDLQQSTTAMESAVCKQPVAIAIEADQNAFQMYTGGVMSGSCGSNLDHGVLMVGFGTDSTYGDYWKVKNSWGANWGEQGYIRMCRNCNKNRGKGQCGLLSAASYANV